jgi:hypothetical protein
MAKASKTHERQESEFELLQGGKLPEGDVRRHLAGLRQKLAAETKEKLAIRQQAAKYLNDIQPPVGGGRSAKITQAENGLRAITEQLAKQKLPAPRKLIRPPIVPVWGTYTLTFTPFYSGLGTYATGQILSVTGDPTISASGVDALGQMTCTVETNYSSPSSGTASNMLGVYFKPLFDQATVSISFDSEIAFWWYVNSIRSQISIAEAQGLIQLYQFDGEFFLLREAAFLGLSVDGDNSLDFDVVSEAGPTWHLEAPVSSNHFYFVVISLSCTASGVGWPGSLAGVYAMVTVPSITVTVTADQIVVER